MGQRKPPVTRALAYYVLRMVASEEVVSVICQIRYAICQESWILGASWGCW